jgi:hypothetical protein
MGSGRRKRLSNSSKGSSGLEENSFRFRLIETKDAATGHEVSSSLLLCGLEGFDISFAYK